jgi:nucleotide-binding universal stress UspA family protein
VEVVTGQPADTIVRVAEERTVDLIVKNARLLARRPRTRQVHRWMELFAEKVISRLA